MQTVNAVVKLRDGRNQLGTILVGGEGDEGVDMVGVEPIGEGLFIAIQATRPCTTSIENLM
jgi:hypothetical protein